MIYSKIDSPHVDDIEALLFVQEFQFNKFSQKLTTPTVTENIVHNFQDVNPNSQTNHDSSNQYTTSGNSYHCGRSCGNRGHGRSR